MTDATLPAGRFTPGEFRIGRVFSKTWSVFSRNFFTFVLAYLVAGLRVAKEGIDTDQIAAVFE